MFSLRLLVSLTFVLVSLWVLCGTRVVLAGPEATVRARAFVADHEKKLRPLEVAASLAWWNANVSGKDEDFKRKAEAQNRIDEALANPDVFRELKQIKQEKDNGQIDD